MKYTINELANSKGVSQPVREALLQMEAELDATNRQVEILSDALAESRREVAALKDVQEPIGYLFQHEETGLTTVVDVQQVEWGFEKNNPRHQKIGPVYTPPPAQPAPVQEPVKDNSNYRLDPPEAEPAQRQWVGLTEQERNDIEDYCEMIVGKPAFEAIEAKLKERNT
jgi:hypothetical protein